MATYPTRLPQPRREGFQALFSQPRKRYEMDDGSTVDLRRWGGQPFQYSLSWHLPDFETAAIFEGWVEYAANNGVEYVDMPLMGTTIRMRSVGEPPAYSPSGSGWDVSMKFERIDSAPAPYTGIAQWPAHFPELESDNFTIVPTQGPERSDIESGLAEVRQRFRTRNTKYSGRVLMDQSMRDEFWDFYRDKLQHGIAYFLAPFSNPVASGILVRARLIESPKEEPTGSHYWVSMSFETSQAPLLTRQEYLAKVAVYQDDYFAVGYVDARYAGQYVVE